VAVLCGVKKTEIVADFLKYFTFLQIFANHVAQDGGIFESFWVGGVLLTKDAVTFVRKMATLHL
jgi:hypothetical protein